MSQLVNLPTFVPSSFPMVTFFAHQQGLDTSIKFGDEIPHLCTCGSFLPQNNDITDATTVV